MQPGTVMQATTSVAPELLTICMVALTNAMMKPTDKPHTVTVVTEKPNDMGGL